MSKPYNIFISWSGNRSLWIAETLRDWLPLVLQNAKPWMSAKDIQKGARGLSEIVRHLEGIKVGIICLTPENLGAPWILYESGSLAKEINDRARLCTYLLCNLKPKDVKFPLGMFQHTEAKRGDTKELLTSVNAAISDDPVPDTDLDQIFDAMWPKLEAKLQSIPEPEEVVESRRDPNEVMAEILEIPQIRS